MGANENPVTTKKSDDGKIFVTFDLESDLGRKTANGEGENTLVAYYKHVHRNSKGEQITVQVIAYKAARDPDVMWS
jgi:hypothetical protein